MSANQQHNQIIRLPIDRSNMGDVFKKFLSHQAIGLNVEGQDVEELSLSSSSSTSSTSSNNRKIRRLENKAKKLEEKIAELTIENEKLKIENENLKKSANNSETEKITSK
mgnify:FL=1